MSIQVLENPSSASGRLGKAFGEGVGKRLSEGLPKEIDRMRLSYGIKNIGQQGLDTSNPIDALSNIYNIPGMTPELANNLLGQLQRRQFIDQNKVKGRDQIPGSLGIDEEKPSERMKSKGYLLPVGIEDRNAYEAKLMEMYPLLSQAEAKARADEYASKIEARDLALKSKSEETEKLTNQFLDSFLQKPEAKAYKDVTGRLREGRYITDSIIKALDEGYSPREAANKVANDVLEFSKTKQDLRSTGYGLLKDRRTLKNAFNQIRNQYKEFGTLEDFRDDLMSYQGLSQEDANRMAYPPTQKQKSFIKNIKPLKGTEILSVSNKDYQKIAKNLLDNMQDEDSFYSLAKSLEKKGYDPGQIMEAFGRIVNSWPESQKKPFNERQAREIGTAGNFFPTLGSVFFNTVLDLED